MTHAVEAARLADLLMKAALDLNTLTIALRGTSAVKTAGKAFVEAAGAAALSAKLVEELSK